MKSPLSIIVPCYNAAHTLEQTLSSIVSQSGEYDEIIVVDDGSTDGSIDIARRFPVTIHSQEHRGRTAARLRGFQASTHSLVVNIDSDVVIPIGSLERIRTYFNEEPLLAGGSCPLSFNPPHGGFFTRYKHRYMNYILKNQVQDVSFLYGSLFALRREWLTPEFYAELQQPWATLADDTEIGQHIFLKGGRLQVFQEVQTAHLKQYSLFSLLKNDFLVPRDFGLLFFKGNGYRQRPTTRALFCHTSLQQAASIAAAWMSFMSALCGAPLLSLFFLTGWILLVASFVRFVGGDSAALFLKSLLFTYLDHLYMGIGAFIGLFQGLLKKFSEKSSAT